MQKVINQSRDARKIKYSTKNEKKIFWERERERNQPFMCGKICIKWEREL